MKLKNSIFICLTITLCFLISLQSNNQITQDDHPARNNAIKEDALSVINYLESFKNAHEKYLQKNKVEPRIRCKKCTARQLDLGEFVGGLIGMALTDIAHGKDSFSTTQILLDECLKIVSEGSYSDAVNSMIQIANKTNQVCNYCHYDGHGDTWEKAA